MESQKQESNNLKKKERKNKTLSKNDFFALRREKKVLKKNIANSVKYGRQLKKFLHAVNHKFRR